MKFELDGLAHRKIFGALPLFDPAKGTTVVDPPGKTSGFWAGAPSAVYDEERQRFLLSYRLRKPLEQGRGYATCVAESSDGEHFSTIWQAGKEQFDSLSLEKYQILKRSIRFMK